MWRADDVSFVESLPRLFVVGKTGLVVDTVQGAPHLAIFVSIETPTRHRDTLRLLPFVLRQVFYQKMHGI